MEEITSQTLLGQNYEGLLAWQNTPAPIPFSPIHILYPMRKRFFRSWIATTSSWSLSNISVDKKRAAKWFAYWVRRRGLVLLVHLNTAIPALQSLQTPAL